MKNVIHYQVFDVFYVIISYENIRLWSPHLSEEIEMVIAHRVKNPCFHQKGIR